jgi:uroporphyrinogen decarboxylase
VDTQHLLPFGTPAEVTHAVRTLADELGADGGFVLSAANNVQADTPPPNILAMAAALRQAGLP